MNIEQVIGLSQEARLIYWINERETIRIRKENGLTRPWTDDTILQQYRFCNVRRMDDKVSRWLLNNWYNNSEYFSHPNMLVAVALARFTNKIETLERIGFPTYWRPEKIKDKLRKIKEELGVLYGNAYMIRGNDGMDKVECVVDYYIQPLFEQLKAGSTLINPSSMEATWEHIKESYGLGSFMAGQIVADLRWGVGGSWKDKNNWAPMGPGSLRGINRLRGRDLKAPMTQKEFGWFLADMMKVVKRHIEPELRDRLEAIDYQSCLCELDKYSRVLLGEGRPKQKYPGV